MRIGWLVRAGGRFLFLLVQALCRRHNVDFF